MTRSEEAIQKANAALEFLRKIDNTLLNNSAKRIAEKCERVLTNNQPAAVSFVDCVDWSQAPESVRDVVDQRDPLPSQVRIPELHTAECIEVDIRQCREQSPDPGEVQSHRCLTCTARKIGLPFDAHKPITSISTYVRGIEMIRLVARNQENDLATLLKIDPSLFPPDPPGVKISSTYLVNFIHPDLKDLYQ